MDSSTVRPLILYVDATTSDTVAELFAPWFRVTVFPFNSVWKFHGGKKKGPGWLASCLVKVTLRIDD